MVSTWFEERLRALKLRKVVGDVDGDRLEVSFEAPSTTFWRGGSISRFPRTSSGVSLFHQYHTAEGTTPHDTRGVAYTYGHQQTVVVAKQGFAPGGRRGEGAGS